MVFQAQGEDTQFNTNNLTDANDISQYKNKILADNKLFQQPIINTRKKISKKYKSGLKVIKNGIIFI